jgi:hypothetical protein
MIIKIYRTGEDAKLDSLLDPEKGEEIGMSLFSRNHDTLVPDSSLMDGGRIISLVS